MSYLKFVFTVPEHLQEHFIAELMDMDFYGFEQFDNELIAYVEKRRFNDSNREHIEQLTALFPGCSYQEMDEIEEQNWNEGWEKTIQPQAIGTFLVKPTWSKVNPKKGQILLEIDPKMAFGTGYHATTRLALRQISELDCTELKVMDAGTGTGILGIAAIKKGASHAVGFDTDPWSEENAVENTYINQVQDSFDVRLGGIEQIQDDEIFDLSVANINRNVILEILEFLAVHTKPGGQVLITGLLNTDEEIIRNKLDALPLTVMDLTSEDEWILFHLKREG
jgi:ribosomal protein L11 methyltransferase